MPVFCKKTLACFFLLVAALAAAPPTLPAKPKLVLAIAIDQFRYDYLERFRPYFVGRGFNLLLGGANFVDCRYDYATTVTCAGHATLLTGAYPNVQVKNCGNGNRVIGGKLVDDTVEPCN